MWSRGVFVVVAALWASSAEAAPLVDVLVSPGGVEPARAAIPAAEEAVAALLLNSGRTPLVVNFFATWCGSCVAEIDIVQAVIAKHPGVRGVFVSLDSIAEAPRLARFMVERRVVLPVVHLQSADPSGAAIRLVPGWPQRIPVTLVIAPGGAERARFVGRLDGPELSAALVPAPG